MNGEFLDNAPEWAAPLVALIRWSSNEDFASGTIYLEFLDAIGYSREHFGDTINNQNYALDYVGADYLGDALKLWAVRPRDVEQFLLDHELYGY